MRYLALACFLCYFNGFDALGDIEGDAKATCAQESPVSLGKKVVSKYSKEANSETHTEEAEGGPTAPSGTKRGDEMPSQPQYAKERSGDDFLRLKLPDLNLNKIGDVREIELMPGMVRSLRTLSINPPVLEVQDFLDEDECDLVVAYATSKKQQVMTNPPMAPQRVASPEETFQEWDYNSDGYIDLDEMSLVPGKSHITFNTTDAKEMIESLKMDQNNDSLVELNEMRNTDLEELHQYLASLYEDGARQRNRSNQVTWVWHDDDELLRFNDEYFVGYHTRLASLTGLPRAIIEESEPFQVQRFEEGQFQICRHDSEPNLDSAPCCLYGDTKQCRLCRYLTMTIFLNDVEEGGEVVLPLMNQSFDDVMHNSGEWRGYFSYDQTTGSKQHFTLTLNFTYDGVNRVVRGNGSDNEAEFTLRNSILMGDTIKFEKVYDRSDLQGNGVKYSGKIVSGTRVQGKWWIPKTDKFHGSFFMWFKPFEDHTKRSTDRCHHETACPTAGLSIKPKRGSAIISYNHRIDPKTGMVGELRQESMIGHCPVRKGAKWVATTWINVIGDGETELRAWRRGSNWLSAKERHSHLLSPMATNVSKLQAEQYEVDFIADMRPGNHNRTSPSQTTENPRYRPPSHVLNAMTSLINAMDKNQMVQVAKAVHLKLRLTCIPLVVEQNGKVVLVDGSKAD